MEEIKKHAWLIGGILGALTALGGIFLYASLAEIQNLRTEAVTSTTIVFGVVGIISGAFIADEEYDDDSNL